MVDRRHFMMFSLTVDFPGSDDFNIFIKSVGSFELIGNSCEIKFILFD